MKNVWSNLIRSSKTMYPVASGIQTTFCNRFIQNFWDSPFFISLFCSMFYRFICSFFYIIHTYLLSQKYNLITAQLENAFKKKFVILHKGGVNKCEHIMWLLLYTHFLAIFWGKPWIVWTLWTWLFLFFLKTGFLGKPYIRFTLLPLL